MAKYFLIEGLGGYLAPHVGSTHVIPTIVERCTFMLPLLPRRCAGAQVPQCSLFEDRLYTR